ncbi:MAG TPA: M23 family metallopeptidase [Pseudosphingobacterium sp.]|nr:M23 family metallopeptidase [Pseudosphingobacterium sp.]
MINYKKATISFLFLLHFLIGIGQETSIQPKQYPLNYFTPPLSIPPQASGSFGELRTNHFHSGTDYRTNQREGYPVYASADGYISRARVQIGGGGNALYINHPNGYTSVYMHLQRFNDKIISFVKNKQYAEKHFSVDFPLAANLIPVKKGEIIAYSGNTGGSAGPHLHFELRDTKSEHTINAQLFGLTIPDRIPPSISGMTVYRLGNDSYDENTPREHLQVVGSNGNYKISPTKTITINGATGFGIVSSDQNSASSNRNGVYSIELLLDGKPIYTAVFERFSFENSRAINSHIDYATYILHRRRIQKSFVEPGNKLEIYHKLVNNGIIDLKDELLHEITYKVKDIMGNTSTLSFNIRKVSSPSAEKKSTIGTTLFHYDQDNSFENNVVKVNIPKGNLYSNLYYRYSQSPPPKNGYSSIQHIHNRMVPIHQGYTLAIKAVNLPSYLQSKALIVNTEGESQGGVYKNGYVSATMRTFGSFYIAVDTIAPIIRSINLSANRDISGINRINFKISDNLSGIQSFDGYIDNQWVLMEYDPKSASLWHVFEQHVPKGKHQFKLIVKDWKENTKVFEAEFIK